MPSGRKEFATRSDRADPCAYHPKRDVTEPRGKGATFGSAKRMLSERRSGPAAELPQADHSSFRRAPSHSFGSANRGFELAANEFKTGAGDRGGRLPGVARPGPGQHCPNPDCLSTTRSAPSYGMTPRREPRVTPRTTQIGPPGPGSYSCAAPQRPSCKFAKAERMATEAKSCPGPGRYDVSATRTGHASTDAPKWSMPGRPGFSLAHEFI